MAAIDRFHCTITANVYIFLDCDGHCVCVIQVVI